MHGLTSGVIGKAAVVRAKGRAAGGVAAQVVEGTKVHGL